MIIGILPLVALVVVVVLVVRRLLGRGAGGPPDVHAVRRFFQYVLLYGLLIISAVGVSGLLTRLLDRSALVTDPSALARSLAFAVVGVPLYAVLAAWTRRAFRAERAERAEGAEPTGPTVRTEQAEGQSLAWAGYLTAACLTALIYAMINLATVLAWALRLEEYDPGAAAGLAVWGLVWAAHWVLDRRVTPAGHAQLHHLAGSLAGLGLAAAGVGSLVAGAIEALTGMGAATGLVESDDRLRIGAVMLLVGVPVWLLYWWRTALHASRGPLWLAYVLLTGVAGGLVTAVTGASIAGYDVLVWLVGRPWSEQASVHFRTLPPAVGAAVAGVLVWWYHHTVVRAPARERTEVVRVYEYLVAGGSLVAATLGLTMVIVASVEALTSSQALLGTGAVNTLLAALTIMGVGGPVWAVFWRRIQQAARTAPAGEHASPTRRVYLVLLFGASGVAAVIALLVGAYVLAEDALTGSVTLSTLHSLRFPIGILVSTGVLAAYHAVIYSSDRTTRVALATDRPGSHGPRYVLLVGPPDPQVARTVAARTGGRVQTWRTDDGVTWTADGVLAALAALGPAPVEEAVVVCEPDGVHAFAVHRH